ncbi:MAG: hypothetical protein AAF683_00035 [Pseudomonadota bacterium]
MKQDANHDLRLSRSSPEILKSDAHHDGSRTNPYLAQFSLYSMSPQVDAALDGKDHWRAIEMYIADIVTQHLRAAYGRVIERYYEGHKLTEFMEDVPRIVTYIWLHQIELKTPNVIRIQEITNDLMLMDFPDLMKKYRADYTHGNRKRAIKPLTKPPVKLRLELAAKRLALFLGLRSKPRRDMTS